MEPSTQRWVGFCVAAVGVLVAFVAVVSADVDSPWQLAVPIGVFASLAGAGVAAHADSRDPGLDP
ncbi:MAG TPA: hypothetical protein VF192_01140 [Longimicrobiales bacterium]